MPAELTATALRCEYLSDPLGIDVPAPRLSWALDGDGGGRSQSAYRIRVAADPAPLWRIANRALTLDVTLAPNTHAEVHVPTSDLSAVVEGNRPTRNAEGVRLVREEDGAAVFAVGSGTYAYRAPWAGCPFRGDQLQSRARYWSFSPT